jgi:hypothetical protein
MRAIPGSPGVGPFALMVRLAGSAAPSALISSAVSVRMRSCLPEVTANSVAPKELRETIAG